ncbi:hypothetical protein I4U23_023259 [Adineta vaga]|nr:hypothetical protein I4U23_023259 [Adineta vaga]
MGVVPMLNVEEQTKNKPGRHAMLAVGYSDKSQSFLVRNSWRRNWGDEDVWVIRKLAQDNFNHEYWDNDDLTDYRQFDNNNDLPHNDDKNYEIKRVEEIDTMNESLVNSLHQSSKGQLENNNASNNNHTGKKKKAKKGFCGLRLSCFR